MSLFSRRLIITFGLVSFATAAFMAGMYVNEVRTGNADSRFPNLVLKADSAVTGERFAMATGKIDQDVDGLYTLDYLSGELQCMVISKRTGTFNSIFKANVANDLGVGQNAKYLMVTGRLSLPRGARAARSADSVVYVLNTNSGNFAAYAAPWRPEFASTGRPQAAELIRVDMGKARNVQIRD